MAAGEVNIECPGCAYKLRLPVSAVRRDSFYCPQCGKNIPLGTVQTSSNEPAAARSKPRRSSRPAKRR